MRKRKCSLAETFMSESVKTLHPVFHLSSGSWQAALAKHLKENIIWIVLFMVLPPISRLLIILQIYWRVYCITIPSLQTFLPISNVLHHSKKFRGLNIYTHCCLKFSGINTAKQCTVLNSKTGCTDVAIWVLIIREYGIYCYTPVGKLDGIATWELSSLVSYSSTMLCLSWYSCAIF